MININNYINERHSHSLNTNHRLKNISSPDKIKYNHTKIYNFENDYATPFIYNLFKDKVVWGDHTEIHNDILFNLSDKAKLKYGLEDVTFVDELYNSELENKNKCGRIWVIPIDTSKNRKYDVYIAWWNKLDDNTLIEYSNNILKEYNKKFKRELVEELHSYIVVTYTGNFKLVDPQNNIIEIKKNDKTRESDLEKLKNIHLATQQEKNKFLKKYKEDTYLLNQTKYWNTTKSKTAAEYNSIKVIGDSLEINNINNMKTLLEYILEERSISFDNSKRSDRYGECIILAGGPGSGKGFIQNKILSNFKVYDVDEMKKQYIKLVNAGKIKDDHKYNLKNPDDTSKVHGNVKERDWKNKQRKAFWDQRKRNEEHSSGLLPNILFDMVSGNKKDLEEVIKPAIEMGYRITVIWVVCNKETASIGNKIRERQVNQKVIDTGHADAYDTMKSLFNNKWPDLTELITNAWVGFSAGYCRKLLDKYAKSPVMKIKSKDDDKFNLDNALIDEFLKDKQPIDKKAVEKQLASKKQEAVDQAKLWMDIVKNEYDSIKESIETNYSVDNFIHTLKNELKDIL